MLGEKITQERGRVTGTRVLESFPQPKVETTFEGQGSIFGLEYKTIGTYWSAVQPTGALYGEGNGVLFSKEGSATWKGSGIGQLTPNGGVKYRGAIYYQTAVERWRRLNTVAVVFEFDVDENGNTSSVIYEWL